MYFGIAIVAYPYSLSWVGIVIATFGTLILAAISMISSYFLFKARNRFKETPIVDLPDLGYACYGPKMRFMCEVVLIICQVSILLAYMLYLGDQS
jgi:amino acid permease